MTGRGLSLLAETCERQPAPSLDGKSAGSLLRELADGTNVERAPEDAGLGRASPVSHLIRRKKEPPGPLIPVTEGQMHLGSLACGERGLTQPCSCAFTALTW